MVHKTTTGSGFTLTLGGRRIKKLASDVASLQGGFAKALLGWLQIWGYPDTTLPWRGLVKSPVEHSEGGLEDFPGWIDFMNTH